MIRVLNTVNPFAGAALLLAVALAALPANGAASLYEAEVPVDDQSDDERSKAFGTALWEVLVKITGDRSVPSRPEVQTLFSGAQKLVQQFRYREIEKEAPVTVEESGADATDGALAVDVEGIAELDDSPSHMLWVQFGADALERQLSRLGIAVWGRERPETLVWLAVEDRGQRYLLDTTIENEIAEDLLSAGRQRGVPLLLPVMDVADRLAVQLADVRGNFERPIRAASRRYGATSILAGNLARVGGDNWQAQWTLYRGSRSSSWRVQTQDRMQGLLAGMEGVASVLSRELAVGYYGSGVELVQMTVHDVHESRDYASVLGYLRGLSLVQEVMVERVHQGRVTVGMRLRGSADDLRQTIDLGSTLVAVRNVVHGENPLRVLQYALAQ